MNVDTSPENPCARSHVVVGDGITAVAFIENCQLNAGDELVVLGKNASQLGRGVAYAAGEKDTPWRFAYLLNSPADDIDPAFAHWLSERWGDVQNIMRGRRPDWLAAAQPLAAAGDVYGVNAPRELYGDFVVAQAEERMEKLRAAGVKVRLMDVCAILIAEVDGMLQIETADGQTIVADSVDVAPGGPSNLRIDGDDGRFSAPTLFGHEKRIAEHVRRGAEIFCIGGNAAMLDALRLCQSIIPEDALRFVACAPDGEVPPPLIPRIPRKLTKPKLSTGHASAKSFLDEVSEAIQIARDQGDEMREIRAGFRAHFLENGVSTYVSESAEARQVPATLRFWLRGGTRDTIVDMHKLIQRGKARMIKGMVVEIEHDDDRARVLIRDTEGKELVHETGFVINCAGAGPTSEYDPLTEHMIRQGWVDKCPVSKGLAVGPGCSTRLPKVRHLSPATTVIGDEVMAMPLYDAHILRTYARRAYV
ncbi:FAD/NAD(P)-binding protein [uncultured Roseobacter sp.]|uniref:FAD/NAD(P)-binding protein n=1 Tax=uncultured Roseobacter sp. TaxID=114847 RepID=UPI002604C441|nr:FAD/NAD(P)-binding protein [uncultured Roseobacter sp.]